jgi:outer membrane protein assembly factor BamB
VDDKVVLLIDQAKDSYVAAFEKENGHLSWKTPRPDAAGGYSTPLGYRPKGQARQVIVSSPLELVGYSAQTGEKLWWVEQMGFQPQTSPILDSDTVYANVLGGSEYWENTEDFDAIDKNHDGQITPDEFPDSYGTIAGSILDANDDGILTPSEWKAFGRRIRGGGPSALVAVRLGGLGDLTESGVAWRLTKGLPGISSPLIYQRVLYLIRAGGLMTALDPVSGRIVKQSRLVGALDDYFSSPVAAEDKIYVVSLSGKVSVLKAGLELEILAVNDLHEECYASPALGPGEIYIRTQNAVYAFSAEGI